MNRLSPRHPLASLALVLALLAPSARAHDVGLSSSVVLLSTNRLTALLTFAVRETEEVVPLDADLDGVVSESEFAQGRERLALVLATNCSVRFDTNLAILRDIHCELDSSNNVDVHFECELRTFHELELDFGIIRQLTPGHRMFFTLNLPTGETIAERLLSQNSPFVSIQLDVAAPEPPPATPTFVGFLKLGVEHIATGYDHLLFLFGLLLVTRNFGSAVKVITCFTLAHSLTLAVATLGFVPASSRVVEPLIALTIVYVGAENIWKHGDPHGRWLLTFAFGLIHGLGFASVLRGLGVSAHGGAALPLLAFNLGVEIAQLAVAILILPLIWQLRTKETFLRRGVPAGSGLVAILGAIWFLQRVWPK